VARNQPVPSTVIAVRDAGRAAMAQQRKRAQELLQLIRRRMADITDGFYEIGECLAEMNNNRLHVALGYGTLAEMLAGERILGAVQAGKLITVATLVPREDAVRLGPEMSYAVTRYAHATGTDTRGLLDGHATVDGQPLDGLTAGQVRDATRKAVSARLPPNPEHQQRLHHARAAQAALRKRGVRTAQATATRKDGRWVYNVALDEADLARLLAALR